MTPAARAPEVIDLRGIPLETADLEPVREHLHAGGVVAYPTETVYGFGGLCTPAAVARVLALKGRGAERPLLVLAPDRDALAGLEWTEPAAELAAIFWPGAVTLVLPDPRGIFPAGVRSAAGAVAVRVSPHPLVRTLLAAVGEPLTSTSANAPGRPPARSGTEAAAAASALGGEGITVLDAGTLPASGPSTIVDCSGPEPVVLREGTVPIGRLRCALPEIDGRHDP